MHLLIYIDGGSRGNPGPAAAGVVLHDADTNELVDEAGFYLGKATNNFAEYQGLLKSLDLAKQHGADELTIRSDSELMVRQVTGVYKVKSDALKPLHAEAVKKLDAFSDWNFEHVRREKNKRADELVNITLDKQQDVRGESPKSTNKRTATANVTVSNESAGAFWTVQFTDDPNGCPAKCVSMKKYPFGPGLPADFCIYAAQDLFVDRPLNAGDPKSLTKSRKCHKCGAKMSLQIDGSLD